MDAGSVRGGGTVTYLFTLPGTAGIAGEDDRRQHLDLVRRAAPAGRPVEILGDGVIVLFPSAMEAVACAQSIRRGSVAVHGGGPAPPRIGLHAGEPIADEEQYLSTPVALTQRLCRAASAGQVLVSNVMAGLIASRHSLREMPRAEEGDGATYELLPSDTERTPAAGRPGRIPVPAPPVFVGRAAELDALTAAWAQARTGERRLVFLTGEPGIGKTTVAGELARRVLADGGTVLFGRCDEEALVPHQPFVEALRQYVMACPTALLAQQVGDTGGELVRLIPELTERLPQMPAPLHWEEDTERYRLYEAVAGLVHAIAAEAPVLFVLDDLHWADKPTLLLLRHVLARAEPAALLAVGTYREVGLTRTHPLADFLVELRRHLRFERITLRGFGDAEVASLLRASTGSAARPGFAEALRRHTEGNPFFVQGLLDLLTERYPDVEWTTEIDLEEAGIPEGVRDLVGRRLSALDEQTNRVLAVAAVAGLDFELPVLERAGGWSPDDVLDAVEQAAGAGLVVEVPDGGARFRFSHALVRQTLYEELATVRRVRLHRHIGDAIEELHAQDLVPHIGQLAYHFAEAAAGGAVEKAVHYSAWAAMRSEDAVAYEEAASQYLRALHTMEYAGEPDHTRRAELLLAFAHVSNRSGDVEPAREAGWEAAGLAREAGDPELLGRAALLVGGLGYMTAGTAPVAVDASRRELLEEAIDGLGAGHDGLRARLLARLALELAYTDERGRMAPITHRAVELARRAGDRRALGSALSVMDSILWGPDQVQERIAAADELARLAENLADRELALQGYSWRLQAVLETGDMVAFDADLARYERVARELRQPLFVGYATMFAALRAGIAGRFEESERLAAEALAVGQRQNELASAYFGAQLFWVWWQQGRLAEFEAVLVDVIEGAPAVFPAARAALALLLVELGRTDEAARHFEELARGGFEDLPRDTSWPILMTLLTPVCAALDDAARAALLHGLLLPFANRLVVAGPPPAGCYGPASHYLGVLAAVRGRPEEAEADFRLALQLAGAMHAPAYVAQTECEYGGLLLGVEGRRQEGQLLLGRARETAMGLGLDRLARRVDKLASSA